MLDQAMGGRNAPEVEFMIRQRLWKLSSLCIPVFLLLAAGVQANEGDGGAARGAKLVQWLGCMECHTVHGKGAGIFAEVKAPEWAGSLGTTVEMESGEQVEVTTAYLFKSIMEPDAQVVKGYPAGKMPTKFAYMPEKDVAAIVAYIESLSPPQASEAESPVETRVDVTQDEVQGQEIDEDVTRGAKLVQWLGCMECHTVHGKGAGIFAEVKAPEWAGSLGTTVEMESGEEIEVTPEYLFKSIMDPDASVVKGYPAGKMPTRFAQLPEKDVAAIVAYICSLSAPVATPPKASERVLTEVAAQQQ